MSETCRSCQHPETAHSHYRAGTDCGWCSCPAMHTRGENVRTVAIAVLIIATSALSLIAIEGLFR